MSRLPREPAQALATTLPRAPNEGLTVCLDPDLDHDPGADLSVTDPLQRYELHEMLGEGGMGEVLSCRDRRIGREVAMKVVRRFRRDAKGLEGRFLREARVQGQLEHPAIVPVYDLGKDTHGAAYFTMKRVRGETLETILERLTNGDREAEAEYTRHKLLAAFARVCLAVHFAHTRGVVHRDLKPSNVMLGDFGEVYVLDWGVAKVAYNEDEVATFEESGERRTLCIPESGRTADGLVLGTPGYMAPEQRRGERVDPRADVHALGAILFEIMTLEPLHAAKGRAELPPEIAAAVERATAEDREARHASARELSDEVERFLAGDRDLLTRQNLSRAHLDEALSLVRRGDRTRALEEVGRAIALDPSNRDAFETVVRLLTEPPATLPAEVKAELDRASDRTRRLGLRRSIVMYIVPGLFFFLPAWLIMGLKSTLAASVCVGSFLLTGIISAIVYKKPHLTSTIPWVTVAAAIAMGVSAVVAGSYVLLPTLVAVNTACHIIAARPHHRLIVLLLGTLSILVPVTLEVLGVIPATSRYENGSFIVTSGVAELREPYASVFFLLVNIGVVWFTAIYVGQFKDALTQAQTTNLLSLWQLRQLVPENVRAATSDPPPARQI